MRCIDEALVGKDGESVFRVDDLCERGEVCAARDAVPPSFCRDLFAKNNTGRPRTEGAGEGEAGAGADGAAVGGGGMRAQERVLEIDGEERGAGGGGLGSGGMAGFTETRFELGWRAMLWA